MPFVVKYIVYIIKKIFCILTIREDKICVLPYKRLKSHFIINIIAKILERTTKSVVLSNYLFSLYDVKQRFREKGIYIYDGKILNSYLWYDLICYIAKMRKEKSYKQEIFVLTNHPTKTDENNIIYLAKQLKRVNIVTSNIQYFKKLEEDLEERLGIAITISNNKRKSLSKAKIIVNFDFNEEEINQFNICPEAIILSLNNKIHIQSKLFNGINIHDYQVNYNNIFNSSNYRNFDKRILYESVIANEKYENVLKKIKQDNIKIVNLIGKNGVIHASEYGFNKKHENY